MIEAGTRLPAGTRIPAGLRLSTLAPAARQAAWQAVLALPLLTLLRRGDEDAARARALATLETALKTTPDDG